MELDGHIRPKMPSRNRAPGKLGADTLMTTFLFRLFTFYGVKTEKHLKIISILFGSIPLQGYSPRRPPDTQAHRLKNTVNMHPAEQSAGFF